jgi:hypothetical protein
MTYVTNGLSFNTLREANAARLPEFKNSRGQPAHQKIDGSDWSPAQWLQAVLGELGEWAVTRLDYESGLIDFNEYTVRSTKELADVVIYLDILARRSLDQLSPYQVEGRQCQGHPFENCPSQALMRVVALLGTYANHRKKLERGDYTPAEYASHKIPLMHQLAWQTAQLVESEAKPLAMPHPGDVVVQAHPTGVNLSLATVDKFNEVSERVGSNVRIAADDWYYHDSMG